MRSLGFDQVTAVAVLPTPTTALAGVVVRLTTDGHPYWCNGTAWVDLGQSVTVASTAPASPALNDLWLQI
jgi:hypothetical protein